MKIMVTSFRGDHNAEVEDVAVAEQLFNKLSGKMEEPLPEEVKTKIPDTFQELEGLWKKGKMGYTAFQTDGQGEVIGLKEFAPEARDVVFMAPIVGG